jgi:hypothetical protein
MPVENYIEGLHMVCVCLLIDYRLIILLLHLALQPWVSLGLLDNQSLL